MDKSASVYRLTQSGAKSAYGSSPVATVEGYLRALDDEERALNGIEQIGSGFRFTAESGANINVTDKLVIDSVTYIVKGKKQVARGAMSYDYFLLVLPDND
jgi:hypothetical protein